MSDQDIRDRIEQLEDERRKLRDDEGRHAGHETDPILAEDAKRLAEIDVELEQLWDQERRRRAAASG